MQKWKLAATALVFALSAAPALAQRDVTDAPDPWVHAATKTPFPAKVGDFQRTRIIEYSADGRDASAAYRLDRGDQWVNVTLYVYPAYPDMTFSQVYDDARSNIDKYRGATLVSSALVAPPSGRGKPTAMLGHYSLPAGAMRDALPALNSDIYLYCPPSGDWLVKYRATGTLGIDFGKDVETLVRAVAWPAKLGG